MSHCAVWTGNIVVGGKTYRQVAGVFPAIATLETSDIDPFIAANPGTEKYVDSQNALIDVDNAVGIGWYIDTSDNSVQRSVTGLVSLADQYKDEAVALARWQWSTIPVVDQSKAGEGNPRARVATLYVIQNGILATNTTLLSDAAKWAEIKAMLQVNARTFQRVMHLHTDDPQAGWVDSILSNRYAYKLASAPGSTRNSIAPQRVDLLGAEALPANWMSDNQLNSTIDDLVAFLDGY